MTSFLLAYLFRLLTLPVVRKMCVVVGLAAYGGQAHNNQRREPPQVARSQVSEEIPSGTDLGM